jgi:hypothetical protein
MYMPSFGAEYQQIFFGKLMGCWQGKVNKKSIPPEVQLKNETIFWYGHKKVDSKYFDVEI